MKITNTEREEAHPEWTLGGNPQAIVAQEARGQNEFVNSDCLPVWCLGTNGKEKLEAMGIKFGEPLESDPLFCRAELPQGWRKVPSDHSMWSYLVDETGKRRAAIFYKAAFYDRNAHISPEPE